MDNSANIVINTADGSEQQYYVELDDRGLRFLRAVLLYISSMYIENNALGGKVVKFPLDNPNVKVYTR